MEREGRPIALLPDFEVVEQSADFGEEQIAYLGLLVGGGSILVKGFFKSQCL
jgi:hypothetical protein